jgi:hypothetical protein
MALRIIAITKDAASPLLASCPRHQPRDGILRGARVRGDAAEDWGDVAAVVVLDRWALVVSVSLIVLSRLRLSVTNVGPQPTFTARRHLVGTGGGTWCPRPLAADMPRYPVVRDNVVG